MAKQTTRKLVSQPSKRLQTAAQVLETLGVNPITEMLRIAYKAENRGEFNTAGTLWEKIASYTMHKMKAIDPADQLQKAQKAYTLQQLQHMKTAILAGAATEIDPESVIEQPQPDALDGLFD